MIENNNKISKNIQIKVIISIINMVKDNIYQIFLEKNILNSFNIFIFIYLKI